MAQFGRGRSATLLEEACHWRGALRIKVLLLQVYSFYFMFGVHRTSSLIWPTPATSHISLPRWTLMCLLQATIAMVCITATARERHADTLTFRQVDTEETALWQRALALRPTRLEFNPQYQQYTNKGRSWLFTLLINSSTGVWSQSTRFTGQQAYGSLRHFASSQ